MQESKSPHAWGNLFLLLVITGIAIHWFGWLHGLGVGLVVFFLSPYHPSQMANRVVENMIFAKRNGVL